MLWSSDQGCVRNMGIAEGCIRSDGSLGGKEVLRRETLYRGRHGLAVERFYDARRSYIYKPVGFPETAGREQWVALHLAPRLPGIRMPAIVAASEPGLALQGGTAWLIYEDLGELHHPRTAADVTEAAGWAAAWHRLPVKLVPPHYDGHTPAFVAVAEQLLAAGSIVEARLGRAGIAASERWMASLPERISRMPVAETVVHGDYHPGNVAMNGDGPIVLDWEYVHRNHPYWDLYCLMDITSFRYKRVPVDNAGRLRALRRYREALLATDEPGPQLERDANWCERIAFADFVHGYAVFASVYSAWILGLIEQDLAAGRAEREQLVRQWQETADVLSDCQALLAADETKGASQ